MIGTWEGATSHRGLTNDREPLERKKTILPDYPFSQSDRESLRQQWFSRDEKLLASLVFVLVFLARWVRNYRQGGSVGLMYCSCEIC